MTEDPKDQLRRFFGEISAGNLDVIDEVLADDFVEHEEFPGIEPTKAGVKQFFGMFRSAFPDMRMEPHEILVDGDLLCVRATMTGTHEGEFMGIPATGKRAEVDVFDMVRLRDGRFTEHWGLFDSMTLMQQLGAIPAPA
jgi:steroid delta-isomerase-like uncharacterized protein